jgi:hypothetical protein
MILKMKKTILSITCLLVLLLASFNSVKHYQPTEINFPLQIKEQNSFALGEQLTYRVHYGWVEAGQVTMLVDRNIHHINNKPCYKIDVGGASSGMLYLFLKMENHFGSYLDTTQFIPHQFYRNVKEGTYRKNEKITFDHENKKILVSQLEPQTNQLISEETFEIGDRVQDIVSIWYLLRNLNFKKISVGNLLYAPVFFDDILYEKFSVKFLGRKVIKTKLGLMKTLVLAPLIPFQSTGKTIFDGENSVELYLSDDKNRIPVKITIKLLVGVVEIDLIATEGLQHPLAVKLP